jgi:hypothetical protein
MNNVIIIKTKILLVQPQVAFGLLLPKPFELFGFAIF